MIVYRELQRMSLDDAVLAFILAREMCHIIGGHHDENVAASVLVAVAAQILFPALNVGGLFASGAAAAGSAAGATALTSGASFLGSRALRASYRGFEITGPPPPCAGPLHIGQMLKILEGFDLGAKGFGTTDTIHLLAEVLKIAFADRGAGLDVSAPTAWTIVTAVAPDPITTTLLPV